MSELNSFPWDSAKTIIYNWQDPQELKESLEEHLIELTTYKQEVQQRLIYIQSEIKEAEFKLEKLKEIV